MIFEYPKIETVFVRDEQTRKVVLGQLRLPEFSLVSRWLVTEKIDGTNIRIHLRRDGTVSYGGRTDAAQLYAPLVEWLRVNLPAEIVRAAFDPDTEAMLFGEGYGARIQKGGGNYRDGVAFRLFDVAVIGMRAWWLSWADVENVAGKLHVNTAPLLTSACSLDTAIGLVRQKSRTAIEDEGAGCEHEGVIARTEPMLFTRSGARVMWKLKGRDFP